jgi:hypothetical protein
MPRLAAALPLALLALVLLPRPALAAWSWPLRGEVITTYRNGDDPYAAGQHRGVDIAGPVGTPVVAAAAGVVRFAGTAGSSGLTVSVRTADGAYDVSYLHLASLAVRRGAAVAVGGPIGTLGTSGVRSAAEPHLHLGVRRAGSRHEYVDPLGLLPPPGAQAPRPPAPVPVTAPAPVRPSPAPVRPAPPPVPRPRARPRVVREPGPAPRAVREPARGPVPHPPRGVLAVSPDRPTPARAAHPGHGRARGSAVSDRAAASGAQRRLPAELGVAPRGATAAGTPTPRSPGRAGGGPDLGWVAACAGLLAAALLFSARRPPASRPSAGRARLAALLPALAGRLRR